MLAVQIMLGIYGFVIVVALVNWLIMPRLNHWLMRHGARDPQGIPEAVEDREISVAR